MSTSVRGKLASLVLSNPVRSAESKLFLSPSVAEVAMLEALYEDDEWVDGIAHEFNVCGSRVEVDRMLPPDCAFMDAPAYQTDRHGNRYEVRMSDRIAFQKFGPRRRRGC
jgi:hypothetical protein